jgi:rhodanese-related sulfurtransferase
MWKESVKSGKSTIIDVRSPGEFAGGHESGSINIPVNEIPERIEEIKNMQQPIVLCCASGGRSGLATQLLTQAGIKAAYNGGPWVVVNHAKNN